MEVEGCYRISLTPFPPSPRPSLPPFPYSPHPARARSRTLARPRGPRAQHMTGRTRLAGVGEHEGVVEDQKLLQGVPLVVTRKRLFPRGREGGGAWDARGILALRLPAVPWRACICADAAAAGCWILRARVVVARARSLCGKRADVMVCARLRLRVPVSVRACARIRARACVRVSGGALMSNLHFFVRVRHSRFAVFVQYPTLNAPCFSTCVFSSVSDTLGLQCSRSIHPVVGLQVRRESPRLVLDPDQVHTLRGRDRKLLGTGVGGGEGGGREEGGGRGEGGGPDSDSSSPWALAHAGLAW